MRCYQRKAHCQRMDPFHISNNYLKWKIDLHWVSSFTKHSVKVKLMTFRSNLRSSLLASEKSCLLSTFLVGHRVTKYLMKTKNVRCWRNIILKHYGWGFNQSLARHIIHWTNDSFSTLNFENPDLLNFIFRFRCWVNYQWKCYKNNMERNFYWPSTTLGMVLVQGSCSAMSAAP